MADRTASETETPDPAGARPARRGRFSVVELIAMVALLGILAVFVAFAVQNSNQASTTASCVAEARTIHTAVAAYRAKHHTTDTPPISGPNSLESDGDLPPASYRWKLGYLGTSAVLGAIDGKGCRGTA